VSARVKVFVCPIKYTTRIITTDAFFNIFVAYNFHIKTLVSNDKILSEQVAFALG
jgi:hypothetical protein